MAEQSIKFIGDMERLVIKPGDRFVIKCEQNISPETRRAIADAARGFFGDSAKVLILDRGFSLSVIGGD